MKLINIIMYIGKFCRYLLQDQEIGYFSVLNPRIRNNIDKKLNVAFAEIDIDDMEKVAALPLQYKEISKYRCDCRLKSPL